MEANLTPRLAFAAAGTLRRPRGRPVCMLMPDRGACGLSGWSLVQPESCPRTAVGGHSEDQTQ